MVKTGRPHVRPDVSSRVKGIDEGQPARRLGSACPATLPRGRVHRCAARTGVNPRALNPSDPRMPNLPPG